MQYTYLEFMFYKGVIAPMVRAIVLQTISSEFDSRWLHSATSVRLKLAHVGFTVQHEGRVFLVTEMTIAPEWL